MRSYVIVGHGPSRSFPDGDPFRDAALPATADACAVVHIGSDVDVSADPAVDCILIELGSECLGVHTGESAGSEGDNRVGFARWRVGSAAPTDLVEVVVQPQTAPGAVAAAREVFESAGLTVAVCRDFPGRILDRLLRPYFNDALRAVDEGVATAADLDKTVRLGLGYPEGPVSLLERTGLDHHHDVSKALFEAFGQGAFAPARRSVVAARRRDAAEA